MPISSRQALHIIKFYHMYERLKLKPTSERASHGLNFPFIYNNYLARESNLFQPPDPLPPQRKHI